MTILTIYSIALVISTICAISVAVVTAQVRKEFTRVAPKASGLPISAIIKVIICTVLLIPNFAAGASLILNRENTLNNIRSTFEKDANWVKA